MAIREQAIGAQVLHFLDDHSLDHNLDNFAFAYRFLIERDAALTSEVNRIIDGGVRIGSGEVARLAGDWSPDPGAGRSAAPQLDRLTLRVLDIIGEVATATGDLNRDLLSAATSLTDGANVRSIVSTMIERTARAESALAEASRQAQSLREELNRLRNDVSRDRITGLPNRAGMEALLQGAIAAPKGCTIAMIDLDNLKAVNDTHGRAVGDRLLRTVATELVDSCRPHSVARWSGGTFMVLFEAMEPVAAVTIVDAARTRIARRRLKVRESDAELDTITLSAGVSSSSERSAAETIADAEHLLGRALDGGRNRTES